MLSVVISGLLADAIFPANLLANSANFCPEFCIFFAKLILRKFRILLRNIFSGISRKMRNLTIFPLRWQTLILTLLIFINKQINF